MKKLLSTRRGAALALLAFGAFGADAHDAAYRLPITAAMGHVDPATVSIQSITPAEAWALRESFGQGVLLIDVRSRAEAAVAGIADGVSALVPYAEIAQPLQWDDARGDVALAPVADFVSVLRAQVAVLGGDEETPILLLCSSGERAAAAARLLALAGFTKVRPIAGGFEGSPGPDGRRHGGWKDRLPWHQRANEALLFGAGD